VVVEVAEAYMLWLVGSVEEEAGPQGEATAQ